MAKPQEVSISVTLSLLTHQSGSQQHGSASACVKMSGCGNKICVTLAISDTNLVSTFAKLTSFKELGSLCFDMTKTANASSLCFPLKMYSLISSEAMLLHFR